MRLNATFDDDDNTSRARQRRMEKRSNKRPREDEHDSEVCIDNVPLSQIKGIKKQARYEPVVQMSKKELSQWRKEARRVRNRESAAASRRKTRERIDELEAQVDDLTTKYEAALAQLAQLQGHDNHTVMDPPPEMIDPAPVSPVLSGTVHSNNIALEPLSLPNISRPTAV